MLAVNLVERRTVVDGAMAMRYLFLSALVGRLSSFVDTQTTSVVGPSPTERTHDDDVDHCKLPLPVGCSCLRVPVVIAAAAVGLVELSCSRPFVSAGP